MIQMPPRVARRFLPALSAAGLATIVLQAQNAPALPDLLKAGADYLVHYSQRLSAIAAQEEYVQYETSSGPMRAPRRLGATIGCRVFLPQPPGRRFKRRDS
jgi:hypothetical protein